MLEDTSVTIHHSQRSSSSPVWSHTWYAERHATVKSSQGEGVGSMVTARGPFSCRGLLVVVVTWRCVCSIGTNDAVHCTLPTCRKVSTRLTLTRCYNTR